MTDGRAAAAPRRAPQGGHGNAEPPPAQIRRTNGYGFTYTPLAWVLWNGAVTRAKNAYAAHHARTEADTHCRNWCGTKTRRVSGLCADCEGAA